MANEKPKEFHFVLIEPLTLSCIIMIIISIVINIFLALPYEVTSIERSSMLPMVLLAWTVTFLWTGFNVFTYLNNNTPRDIWKIGWVGIIGFVGFIPGLTPLFFGLFGLFVFFGFPR